MKKKSFYFEDYTESDLINNNNNFNSVKISLNRVTFLSFIFFSLILIFSIKIIYLSLSPEKVFHNNNIRENFVKKRRNIVDRNDSVLTTNIILYDVGVRPKLLQEKEKKNLLIKLGVLFPELDLNKIKRKLNKEDFFFDWKKINTK